MTTTIHILRALLCLGLTLGSLSAFAQRERTEQAFERMEETLAPLVEEGQLAPQGIGPVLLVGATPAFEETRAWFPVGALESLTRLFGPGQVRVCEACMNPRVHAVDGRLEHNTVLSLPEIARLDEELRGRGPPARSAAWLEETPGGLAVRILSIDNGQVLYAGNFDGQLQERTRTAELYNYTLELGRRLRGESLTHIFLDLGMVPNQHLSLDITEQFGPDNLNLAGFTMSLVDPVAGIGIVYYRVIPLLWDLTIGVQAVMSTITAIATALDTTGNGIPSSQLLDPILTGVVVLRWPIPTTNFAVFGSASTNFAFTVGVSLINVSFLPIIP